MQLVSGNSNLAKDNTGANVRKTRSEKKVTIRNKSEVRDNKSDNTDVQDNVIIEKKKTNKKDTKTIEDLSGACENTRCD